MSRIHEPNNFWVTIITVFQSIITDQCAAGTVLPSWSSKYVSQPLFLSRNSVSIIFGRLQMGKYIYSWIWKYISINNHPIHRICPTVTAKLGKKISDKEQLTATETQLAHWLAYFMTFHFCPFPCFWIRVDKAILVHRICRCLYERRNRASSSKPPFATVNTTALVAALQRLSGHKFISPCGSLKSHCLLQWSSFRSGCLSVRMAWRYFTCSLTPLWPAKVYAKRKVIFVYAIPNSTTSDQMCFTKPIMLSSPDIAQ